MKNTLAVGDNLALAWKGQVRNDTHLDLAISWIVADDQLIMRISERNKRSATGLIIPKGDDFLNGGN